MIENQAGYCGMSAFCCYTCVWQLSSLCLLYLPIRRLTMNDAPHLLAIIESKMAQVRTHLEHNSPIKAQELLTQVETYAEDLRCALSN